MHFVNELGHLNEYSAIALQFERMNCACVALPLCSCNDSKSPSKSLPIRGRAPGAFEGVASKLWRQLERVAQALRSLGNTPMTHARAERLGQRFGVHRATIYRYGSRLAEIDESTAIAGRTRGWKPLASRLSAKQQQGRGEVSAAPRALPFSPSVMNNKMGPSLCKRCDVVLCAGNSVPEDRTVFVVEGPLKGLQADPDMTLGRVARGVLNGLRKTCPIRIGSAITMMGAAGSSI